MFVKFSLCVLALAACLSAYEDKTIAQWLQDNGFTELVRLLKKANLYDTLDNQATGPFTMFAPTDAAFAAIPRAELANLENNPTVLETVLKYHVEKGFHLAPLITNGATSPSLNGQKLVFNKYTNGTITVAGAKITDADQIVNNGVVHKIDHVLLPVTETIGEVLLERQDKYSTLNVILQITDLEPALFGGNITLFAPTDMAFNAIQAALPDFGSPNVKAAYAEILKNHVVNGTYLARDLTDGQVLTTLHGQKVTVHLTNGVMIDNTKVIDPDIQALNGVIHGINGVLVPTDLAG